jgi:two-component system NarL family response regulator
MSEPARTSADLASIRVLIVDDHAIMRDGLAAVFRQAGMNVVGQAGDGESAVAMLDEMQPDVCTTDMRMSPMDGCDVARAIRERRPECKVIILTAYDTDEDVFRALQAGASSYVLKRTPTAELIATIREVHTGHKVFSSHIASRLAEHVSSKSLTPRQQEVLDCLARGESNHEVAATLLISEATVKAHVKAILDKLDARDRTQAIIMAMRRGLLRETSS